ncbi:unnamed protein product [Rhizophagus irregularis]|nr:unnamed protein product [Rhizophagus irregularis]
MGEDLKQKQFNLEQKIPEIEMEMDQILYPDLNHRDIGKQRGYGPCPDPSEQKEGAKQLLGAEVVGITALNPGAGAAAAAGLGAAGVVTEGIGKLTGNQDIKDVGEVWKEAPVQPVKEVKKAFDK